MNDAEMKELIARIDERLASLAKAFETHCSEQFGTNQAVVLMAVQAVLFFIIGKFA